jgi:hypothetical protein
MRLQPIFYNKHHNPRHHEILRSGVKLVVETIVIDRFGIEDIGGAHRKFPRTIAVLVIKICVEEGVAILNRFGIVRIIVIIPLAKKVEILQKPNIHVGIGPVCKKYLGGPAVVVIVFHKAIAHFKVWKTLKIAQNTGVVILRKTFATADFAVDDIVGFAQEKSGVQLKLYLFDCFAETAHRRKGFIGKIAVKINGRAHLANAYQIRIGLDGINAPGIAQISANVGVVEEIKTEIG